jgi:hypothetical protein
MSRPAPIDVAALLARARAAGLATCDASHRAGSPYVRLHGSLGQVEIDALADVRNGRVFGSARDTNARHPITEWFTSGAGSPGSLPAALRQVVEVQ